MAPGDLQQQQQFNNTAAAMQQHQNVGGASQNHPQQFPHSSLQTPQGQMPVQQQQHMGPQSGPVTGMQQTVVQQQAISGQLGLSNQDGISSRDGAQQHPGKKNSGMR